MDYKDFLKSKELKVEPSGFRVDRESIQSGLFEYQTDIVLWALQFGKAAVFAGCGLGKTRIQIKWADQVACYTGKPVLILAPLAVAPQTVREGQAIGIDVNLCREATEIKPGVNIANYERLHKFDASQFGGIVLDESSILKSFSGKIRNQLIESFAVTPYKLACTATPSPNDYEELGNHAEFLGVMTRVEMLAMFFVHDGGDTAKWRLKGHAEAEFWKWVCGWSVALNRPSDLGYADDGFDLPELRIHQIILDSQPTEQTTLFAMEARTMAERRGARKLSLDDRVQKCAELARAANGSVLISCDFNAEGDALEKAITGAVQVSGSDDDDHKEKSLLGFAEGQVQTLITKPRIAGFGMNFQIAHTVICCGISDSYEQFYQLVRRCWRFGQTKPVDVYVVISDAEAAVLRNIKRKEAEAERMQQGMIQAMAGHSIEALHKPTKGQKMHYQERIETGDGWAMHLGDCVETVARMESDSIGFSVFSPPFASLYTYSNSDRDMGNCKTHSEFYEHFSFLVKELHRVMMPGRLVSFHCMNLPTSKERDGYIGISDFRGDLIRIFQDAGFIYHSEVCIWKNPVMAMQRTKALGLLHKQLKKDSAMSRQGIPDYLVTMRKRGENPKRITHTNETFPVGLWQNYASPVWMDIDPSDTLQKESAREEADERHICPLQLQVIDRALDLWSAPGDLVLSPFAGIGSEGFVSIKKGRRFVGVELKESYFRQAVANLQRAEILAGQNNLFAALGEPELETEEVA